MRRILLLLMIPLALILQDTYAQNAPVTTVGTEISYGTTSVVPIMVSSFTEVGSCEFLINFNPDILTITSVSLGPGVSSYYFLEGEVAPGVYKVTWLFFQYGVHGLTLPDNSVFMNINMQRVDYGYSPVNFDISLPQNCFYTDWQFNSLASVPQSFYFYNGSVSFASGASQWNGNFNNDWSNPLNWDAGVPESTSIAIVDNVTSNLFPATGIAAQCLGLNVEGSASVHISANSSLTVFGNVFNNGQFIIESNSAGDGSFIGIGTISGTGIFTAERYLTSEKWHYVSSPISNGLSVIFTDIYLKKYAETAGEWQYITSLNEPLNPMQGFASWPSDNYTGPTTVFYTGNFNTGVQQSAVLTNTAGLESAGYNLVGNPYTSSIDWDSEPGWTKTNLDNAIYIYNPNIGNYGSYINGSALNGVTNHIPRGQGFFVKVSSGHSSGALSVNVNAREHSSQPFLKSSKTNTNNQFLRLKAFSTLNTFTDETIITINPDATPDFDHLYDAYKLEGADEAPQIFTVLSNQDHLSVNNINKEGDVLIVPLNFKAGIAGLYTIEASEILNFESSADIILEDIFDNITINLNDQPSYSFSFDLDDDAARFRIYLHFNPSGIDPFNEKSDFHIYSDHHMAILEGLNGKLISGNIEVYTLLGQTVFSQYIDNENRWALNLDQQGIYLVTFNDVNNQKQYVQKIQIR